MSAAIASTAIASKYSTKETIHANGIPRIIPPTLIDRAFIHAQHAHKNEGDRILVHRKTIAHNDNNYTIDYITTQILDVWHQYTVIYLENSPSPFSHTIDFRFETNELLLEEPKVHCSSSDFRAAAYAAMKVQIADSQPPPLPPRSNSKIPSPFMKKSFM